MRQDATHWSLSERPGYLRITTQEGDLWMDTNSSRNMLLQAGPSSDFEISTRLIFSPSRSYQAAALIAYQDDDNYVLFGKAASDGSAPFLVFSYESGGQQPQQRFAGLAGAGVEIHLKLTRAANIYTAYYSFDGLTWTIVGDSYTANLSTVQVGLTAFNAAGSSAPEIDADWDWVCLNPGSVPTWTPTVTPTPTRTPTRTATLTATPAWQTIYSDSFDGAWPSLWQRSAANPKWGRTTCKAEDGAHSVWPAVEGTGAVTPCVTNYPNNVNAWMIYGPFSLAGASAAEVTFWRWQKTEASYDYLWWGASVDGNAFGLTGISGDSGGWTLETFDLSNVHQLGDLRGRPQVWIAFRFTSDSTETDVGAFLDNVVIRKR